MMKKNYSKLLLLVYVLALFVVACSGKKEAHDHEHEHEASASDEHDWKEMDSFHMIMAETFHPYKDSANLEPIKVHAEHLAIEAEKWSSVALPEKVNNDEVKANIEKLKADTRALADAIKAGSSDEAIAASLTTVHDQFHKIQEAWYGGHDNHHKEEH
ncbi:MAG: hypothetical protein JNM57_07340 [Cyclobacteriaceae bacterium]|nr:hypothetical protein [Cyclobacteriaceae bacterium]